MNKAPQDVIIRPIITEESMMGVPAKRYTFKVDKRANKTEIKLAVEKLFGVKVASVNTMNVPGHQRVYGRYQGHTSEWKKAIVTLKADSAPIEFFDGMY